MFYQHIRRFLRGKRSDSQAGFTLVEVLISMFIFAIVSAGTLTALTNFLRGKAQIDTRLAEVAKIDAARALMKSDFANVRFLPMRDAYGGVQPYLMVGGMDNLVEFTRGSRINPGGLEPRGEFQRVTYVFEDGKLIRRSLGQANPAPQTKTQDRVLLENIQNISVEFYTSIDARSVYGSVSGDQSALTARDHILISVPRDANGDISLEQLRDLPNVIKFDAEFKNGDHLVQYFEIKL